MPKRRDPGPPPSHPPEQADVERVLAEMIKATIPDRPPRPKPKRRPK